jgi:hypothetical protein
MKKGILYNLYKIKNSDLSVCIKELNISSRSAKEYNYPKCLLLSKKVTNKERDLIEKKNFDIIIEYEQEFDGMADKLLAFEYTPFEKNILVDSDILFLNERWYNIIKPHNSSLIIDIPDFSLEHLFDQTFGLSRDTWAFKKTVIKNNIAIHTYQPDMIGEMFKKYNDRSNTFGYNTSVIVFDKSDENVNLLFDEAFENSRYLRYLYINGKLKNGPDDQIPLCFAIKHKKIFPSYIHSAFVGGLTVKDDNFYISEPITMAHCPHVFTYINETNFNLP